ncbi:MAG: putative DNA-binding domain-containing protein [Alphaproteobacteria bacterium]
MLRELQSAITCAIVSGDPAAALAIIGPGDGNEARLEIHRANYRISLTHVLAGTFPSVRRTLDTDSFRHVSEKFVVSHPPRRPQLLDWGGDFPAFLSQSPRLANWRWLPDLARLDWARNQAHFAADASPVLPADLERVPAGLYESIRFRLVPSVRVVTSVFPVATMWAAAMAEPMAPLAANGPAEGVLVLRPWRVVTHRAVSDGDRALLAALGAGMTLAEAAELACRTEPGFDLLVALAAHLAGGTFATFTTE